LKAIFSGKNARQVTGSQVFITDFAMKTFRNGNTNQIELIAEAPECLLDRNSAVASSAGAVKAYTANTNFYIQGVGFFCQQSNGFLVISNEVQTILHKEALGTNSPTPFQQSPALSSTAQILQIFSDHFRFLYESNLVTYNGNVRVEDSQMTLTCDLLNIYLTTNKSVQRIVAENSVNIVNKKDGSRATGDQAIYTLENNRELIELTGQPFWSDGKQEGRAEKFIYDRSQNLFRAEKNAVFKLPRSKIGQISLLDANSSSPTNTSSDLPVVISSERMTFKFPATNGPIQEMIAETNVIITSESDASRATAERVTYSEATGQMELTGKPRWKMKESEISGEILFLGRTHFFGAKTNVQLKIPALLFGKTFAAKPGTISSVPTNQFVEILAEDFFYTTNAAVFRGNVRAQTKDAALSQINLSCERLDVLFGASNQVQTIAAKDKVFLRQIPDESARTNLIKRTIACDTLKIQRAPLTGFFENIFARTNVVCEQTDKTAQGERLARISAQVVTVKFFYATNQIESVVADTSVRAEKIDRVEGREKLAEARGEHGVFDATRQTVEMTGKPTARMENFLVHDARVLRWNLITGKISGAPYKITALTSTNSLKTLLQPKP
ncbi:MAG: LptA/OstA family protein, partial [Verrucomicrobiota bacterium]